MADSREYLSNADEKGSVNISEDVIAQLAVAAMADTDGVAALSTAVGRELRKKSATKGAKIFFEEGKVGIEAYITVKQGYPVTEVAKNVQSAVSEAVESITGFPVMYVNVQVCGISLGKEK